MKRTFSIAAFWDEEAKVFYSKSDITGLHIEADETYVGGKPRKRNKINNNNELPPPLPHNPRGRDTRKTPVIGALERGGKVVAQVASDLTGKAILRFIKANVDPHGSILITDELKAYNAVRSTMAHATVNHSKGEYVDGETHTNTIEGFWLLLKRAWYGTHHHYRKHYTPLYVAEACWEYNERGNDNTFGAFMRGILKPTGSIYLHCDPTASHYIKVMMDGIFGHGNFLNEIVWGYRTGGVSKRWFGRKHDTLLYYAIKRDKHTFNVQMEKSYTPTLPEPHTPSGMKLRVQRDNICDVCNNGSPGQKYRFVNLRDTWTDVDSIYRNDQQNMGYATQKPLALLERIIKASSNEGDVVFDPFCGCATTVEAAHKLGRQWIGIDIAIHAIKRVAKVRLQDRLGLKEGIDFEIEGVPYTIEGARDLWERDKYHFQKWAVEQVDGFVTSRKTADGGVDGRLYFDLGDKTLESIVLEVKGGANVGISVVRDLRGVLERENAPMAGLIVLDDLGDIKQRNFRKEMAQAGDFEVNGVQYARMQMLTVAEILEGKKFEMPSVAKGKGISQSSLPLG